MQRKRKDFLETTTCKKSYKIVFRHYPNYDWFEEKKCKFYTSYWRSRDYRCWKTNRKTKWK